jgi:hypothetical protein
LRSLFAQPALELLRPPLTFAAEARAKLESHAVKPQLALKALLHINLVVI